ncbi:hypothetical protein [Pseudorhodoplanes sp.]|uniref:hypothetical protein n=1 Tax=Pseudorhodoplanes sp. TaxID=1934341 RepID=UPI0039199770
MRHLFFTTGRLGCAAGIAALVFSAQGAQAQFFPFFGPPQQQQQRQGPPPPPPQQQTRPAQPSQAPAKRTQPPQPKAPASAAVPKAGPATAAVPYPDVRAACSAEIRTTCAGVAPGSAESVQCLRPNFAVHTEPCQAALRKAMSAPPPANPTPANPTPASATPAAAAPEPKPSEPSGTAASPRIVSTDRITQPEGVKESDAPDLKLPAMRPTQEARWVNRHCKEDHSLLCQGVTFGQSRVLKCLLSHHSSLTNRCKTALAKR